jgi:hypothetical protein
MLLKFSSQKKKTFALGVPFTMRDGTKSTTEQHTQSELRSVFMGQLCQEQGLHPPAALAIKKKHSCVKISEDGMSQDVT